MLESVLFVFSLIFVFIFICLMIGVISIKFIDYLEDDKQQD